MKINEVTKIHQTYLATVRVVLRDSSMTARTTVTADTVHQAKSIFTRIYGEGNVLNITQLMNEDEEVKESTKTLSPQELQVKSLADKAKQYKSQAKAMKARQQMAKAQQDLMKASRGVSASNKR
jgi:ABC-type lipopolysaccharide export system ATPase subunit